MKSATTIRWTTTAMLAAALAGCGDDEAPQPVAAASGPGSGGSAASGPGGAGGVGGAGGAGGAGGGAPALEVLASFDPAAGQLPEGLAVRGDEIFAGLALLGEVVSVSAQGGVPTSYAQVEGLPVDNAFVTGLAFDSDGRLLAAVPSFVVDPAPGIYRAPQGGGAATLFATDAAMLFPSALGFHSGGDLYVTDSASAAVFRVSETGAVEIFAQDPLLAGDKTLCGNDEALFDIGANGLAVTDGALFVANTDQATILRIPIDSGGSAGALEIVAGPDCATLGGADGMARASDGTLYVALNHQNRIATVSTDGTVTVALDDPLLDFPATVRLDAAEQALYITSFALDGALAGERAHPALLRWTLP